LSEFHAKHVDEATAGMPSSLQVLAGYDPAHGGPSYSVPRLTLALNQSGADSQLLSVRMTDASAPEHCMLFRQDYAAVPLLRGLRLSSGLRRELPKRCQAHDVVHAHGLWLLPNVWTGRAAARAGRPLVVSPRGMLSPEALRFSSHKKRWFWRFVQGPAYAHAACYHATSAEEAEQIWAFGVCKPVAVIANGIDVPHNNPEPAVQTRAHGDAALKTLLFLGRLHPVKGLELLLHAWVRLAPERADWQLCLQGPGDAGYVRSLRNLAHQLGAVRVYFEDPAYDAEKWRSLRTAQLFVLPSRSENFAIAVAEALAAGLPVVATHGAPWSGLVSENCGWWVSLTDERLLGALRDATGLSDAQRTAMGARGRAWMLRDFTWAASARKTLDTYLWLLGRSARPKHVLLPPGGTRAR